MPNGSTNATAISSFAAVSGAAYLCGPSLRPDRSCAVRIFVLRPGGAGIEFTATAVLRVTLCRLAKNSGPVIPQTRNMG